MKNFRDLQVWAKAHAITLDIYTITRRFPREEMYGLVSQMRRCSASIGANIAEGCGRSNNGDFQRFLQQAMGSASELEYHLILSLDLGYLQNATHSELSKKLIEVKRMMVALHQKVSIDRFHK